MVWDDFLLGIVNVVCYIIHYHVVDGYHFLTIFICVITLSKKESNALLLHTIITLLTQSKNLGRLGSLGCLPPGIPHAALIADRSVDTPLTILIVRTSVGEAHTSIIDWCWMGTEAGRTHRLASEELLLPRWGRTGLGHRVGDRCTLV